MTLTAIAAVVAATFGGLSFASKHLLGEWNLLSAVVKGKARREEQERHQESIRKVFATEAMPLPPQPYFAHPYPLQEHFTGRIRERQMLTGWLSGDRPVLALTAIGGMGKSVLTWAWLLRDVLGLLLPGVSDEEAEEYRVAEAARPEGILWWSFYEHQRTFATFLDQALTYASSGTVDPNAIVSAHDKTRALLSILQRRRFLLVLDGFERQLRAYAGLSAAYQGDALGQATSGDVCACVDPHAGDFLRQIAALPLQGRVLLTSRLLPRELDGDLAGCRHEELTALDSEDAVIFFHAQGVSGTRAEIQDACAPYGYRPLALRLLAGLIMRDRRKPGDIQVANRYPVLDELRGRAQHHILQVAYDALDRHKRELLSRIAAFRSPMSYDALAVLDRRQFFFFKSHGGGRRFEAILDDLIDRGLLLFDRGQGRYDLHPIIRQYAYDRLANKQRVHSDLQDYFAAVPSLANEEVQTLEDLAPVIELYHHTVGAGKYDEAAELLRDRIGDPLYYRFGAYQTCIDLLRGLFPSGEDSLPGSEQPALPRQVDVNLRGYALNMLANSYALYGQPRRTVPLYEAGITLEERMGLLINVAIYLGAVAAVACLPLGRLASAEANQRRRIELCREVDDERAAHYEAVAHQELGKVLVCQGTFDEAARELGMSSRYWQQVGDKQGLCLDESYSALNALMNRDAKVALDAARRAWELATQQAREQYPVERDFVRAGWVIGAALTALGLDEDAQRDTLLAEAEQHLAEALTRCRRINMVDHEPDILLSWARWNRARGNTKEAVEYAQEALAIADRCEYRLNQADIHNFLARLALDAGGRQAARHHAEIARERAWCDGPPHSYKPALEEAELLLAETPPL